MTAGKFLRYFIFFVVVANLTLAAIVFIGGFVGGPKNKAGETNAVGSINTTNSAAGTNAVR